MHMQSARSSTLIPSTVSHSDPHPCLMHKADPFKSIPMTAGSRDTDGYSTSSLIQRDQAGPSRGIPYSSSPWSPPQPHGSPFEYAAPSTLEPGRPLPLPASQQYPTARPTEPLPYAIPQPILKADYAPPVFQTFQERKRAKEMARRMLVDGGETSWPSPTFTNGGGHPSIAVDHPTHVRQLPTPSVSAAHIPHLPRPLPKPLSSSFSPLSSPVKATNTPPPVVLDHASLERSDTVSSVRSLDRGGFGSPSKRPLPKPPVVVASSKSLDRGIPGSIPDFRRMSRKQPSTVEESELEGGLPDEASVAPRSSSLSTDISSPLLDPKTPAQFPPVPTINFPDDIEDEAPALMPDIVISGIPLIAVSSEEPSTQVDIGTSARQMSADLVRSPSLIQPSAAILCAGCEQPIIGRIVSAMKRRWHPQCFSCAECGENLEHASCYEWEGKPYCHLDFHDVSCGLLGSYRRQSNAHH